MANPRVWLALVLLAGPAWAAAPQAAAARQHPAATRPLKTASTQPKLSDKQLQAAIQAKFAKSKINADKFTVRVQGGVATIEGKTDVVQHKGTATRMCKTAGAVAVNNRVQISDAARAKAAGNLEEGRRRVQVKRGDARDDRK